MIVIQEQEVLIIEILVLVITMVEVVLTCQSLTTQEITDNTEEIQEVEEEDFQEVDREEMITYLGAHKPIETIEVAAHHPGVITKVAMGNMELVEAIFHGPRIIVQAHRLPTVEVGRLVEVGRQDVANHCLETAQAQVTVVCRILPIGAEVDQVHPDLLYSVNPQI